MEPPPQPPKLPSCWPVLGLTLFFTSVAFAAPEAGHGQSAETAVNIPLNLLFVALLVLANGFFVASEFALVAVRRTRIDQLAAEGSGAAKVVQNALHDLDRYIAATQVGITVASLLLGGIGERTFEAIFHPLFEAIPLPSFLTATVLALGMSYFVMTALHVVIGELMPKSLALQSAEKVTLIVTRPLILFAKLFSPLIWLLNGTGNFLLKLIGMQAAEGHSSVHSPEELDLLVSQSHEGGQLNDTEAEILHRVVRFSDLTLREVMVPRVEMEALPIEMPRLALRAWVHSRPHSRVPIFHGSLDEVVGLAHLKDLISFVAKMSPGEDDDTISLMPVVREALRLPENSTVDKLLAQFKGSQQQMAIVIDEFGGTAGLITLGDLLEQVFGEVADEFDAPEETVLEREGRVWVPGRTLIEEINERYDLKFNAEEADTMAGLILGELGRPAKPGDEVSVEEIPLRVEAVDRLRITRLSFPLPD